MGSDPPLWLNASVTDTEKTEQRGFANLLIGLFGTFRNPTGADMHDVYAQFGLSPLRAVFFDVRLLSHQLEILLPGRVSVDLHEEIVEIDL